MADQVEFDAFVVACSPRLVRTAYLLVHDRQLAEDLLQTALTKAWFAWRRIEGNPEPYVRRVMVTTAVSWWRRRWTREVPSDRLPEQPGQGPRLPTRTCGRPSDGCRSGSGPWSCCGSTRT